MADKLSYLHRGGEQPLLGSTIDSHFSAVAARFPTHEAVVSRAQGARLSYAELDAEVEAAARGLLALGIERGERVGIWSTNNLEWIVVQLATARIGALLVNINPANRVAELEHALNLAKISTLVLIPSFRSSDYVSMLGELCPELCADAAEHSPRVPHLRRLIVFDPEAARETPAPAPGFTPWGVMLSSGKRVPSSEVRARSAQLDPDDPINIQFTSGTTGFPKAVVLSHHNILNNAYFVAEAMLLTERDRLCVPVPFYHCFGMVLANLACLSHGATVVIAAPHFDAIATLDAISEERCTAVHGVPTMFIAELEHMRESGHDTSSLRTGIMAGAPCPPELMRQVMSELGCREILIAYGQTEASPVTHCTVADDTFERRVETVGTNLPHQEVKVIDVESGAIVPTGVQGEVCFRGYHVMRGYFGSDEATADAIDAAHWLHSGDLGILDEDGYLRITGRLKDMIIRGGENIYPAEIEAVYFEHPAVAEIAVFGLPDPKMGEEVAAWIKLRGGFDTSADELREFARDKLSHFKIPRHIWFVDEFPMTITGKIQKFRIRELAAAALAAGS